MFLMQAWYTHLRTLTQSTAFWSIYGFICIRHSDG